MDKAKLKQAVARGAVSNLLFAGAGGSLTYLQLIVVMRILGPAEIGLFALASAIALAMESLSDFGIGDRLIQQGAEDLQESYDCAVTLHFLLAVLLCGLLIAAAPFVARFYHLPDLTLLMAAMSYVAFAGFLQLPLSLLYRDLRYFEQRLFVFLGKVASFIVTVGLALMGMGVWCLVAGGLTELVVTAVPAWLVSPLRPRWRISLSKFRDLLSFGSPVWMSKVSYVLVQQGSVLVLSAFLAVTDVGQFKAAEQLAGIVFYMEIVLGQTIFPVLCKLKDSDSALVAAFTKSSRVSMLWTAGGSVFLWIFAGPIVRYVLTPKWHGAELFMAAQGVALLFGATIFNWDTLCKAREATRFLFRVSVLFGIAFAVIFTPLVYFGRREGAAIGVVVLSILLLISRKVCLDQLRLRISLMDIAKNGVGAALLAAAVALALRHLLKSQPQLMSLAFQAMGYLGVYAGVLLWLDRDLIREAVALVFRRVSVPPPESQAAIHS